MKTYYRKGFGPADGEAAVMPDSEVITMLEARAKKLEDLLGTAREHINDLSACAGSPDWKSAAHEFVGEVDTALGCV